MTVPTQQEAFFVAYQALLDAYVERYKQLADPPDPDTLFWTRTFDSVSTAEIQPLDWTEEIKELKRSNPGYRVMLVWIATANRQARIIMQEHFKTMGYDYTFSPAPGIDHETPKKIKNYLQQSTTYDGKVSAKFHKTAIQVGQLIILSETLGGVRTYTVLMEGTHLSFPFKLSCSGDKEWKALYHHRVLLLATSWSKLTDWNIAREMPMKVRRALGEKAKALYHEYMEG